MPIAATHLCLRLFIAGDGLTTQTQVAANVCPTVTCLSRSCWISRRKENLVDAMRRRRRWKKRSLDPANTSASPATSFRVGYEVLDILPLSLACTQSLGRRWGIYHYSLQTQRERSSSQHGSRVTLGARIPSRRQQSMHACMWLRQLICHPLDLHLLPLILFPYTGQSRRGIAGLLDMTCHSLTPYQRLARSVSTDESWQRDVTLERRIGFYRIKGDAGSGNFSRVMVGIHCLTKGKHIR